MKQKISDNIFDVIDDKITLTTAALTVPEFKTIWDKYKNKKAALARLSFIYHTVSPKSPYFNLEEADRTQTVLSDFLPDTPDVQQEPEVIAAIDKYTKLIETPSLRQLKTATLLVDKVSSYFGALSLSSDSTATLADAKKVLEIIGELPKATQSLIDLKKKVEQELIDTDLKIRGDKAFSSVFDD
jgi:hypothetical protein